MSLVARALEASGIATVVVGSARDIVEYCGTPRYVYTDFPLGNPCGRPYDLASQRGIMDVVLDTLRDTREPGTTVVSGFEWDTSGAWKDNYMRIGPDNVAALRIAGDLRRAERASWTKQSD